MDRLFVMQVWDRADGPLHEAWTPALIKYSWPQSQKVDFKKDCSRVQEKDSCIVPVHSGFYMEVTQRRGRPFTVN